MLTRKATHTAKKRKGISFTDHVPAFWISLCDAAEGICGSEARLTVGVVQRHDYEQLKKRLTAFPVCQSIRHISVTHCLL